MEDLYKEATIYTDKEISKVLSKTAISAFVKNALEYPLLTKEETRELALRVREKQEIAREKLINSNLRLVLSVACKHYKNLEHMKIEDIVDEGVIGLIEAVDRYDPNMGALSTYAYSYIEGCILKSIKAKEKAIRRSYNLESVINKYSKLVRKYINDGLPLPSREEICEILHINMHTLERIEEYNSLNVVSLNQKVTDEKDSEELGNFVPYYEDGYKRVMNAMSEQELLAVLKTVLTPCEYYILYNSFIISTPKTLKNLANELGVTQQRVEQFKKIIKKKVKPYLKEDSEDFKVAKKELIGKFGRNIYNLNTLPISPKSIIFYHFIKEYLSSLEQEILFEKLFGKYVFNRERIARKYKISCETVNIALKSIEQKKSELLNGNYQELEHLLLNKYKTSIFSIDLEKEVQADYEELGDTYGDFTLGEIKILGGNFLNNLSRNEIRLLERFFDKPEESGSAYSAEMDVNLVIHNYKRHDTSINLNKLYKVFVENISKFSEENALYLECFFFNRKDKSEYFQKFGRKIQNKKSLKLKLEKLYFKIYNYFWNDLSREQYLSIRYKNLSLYPEKIKLLDMYFGLSGKDMTFQDIADYYHTSLEDVSSKIRKAKIFFLNIYTNRSSKKSIDKSLYVSYLLNPIYCFTEETRKVLNMYLIENKNYEEISESLNLTKNRLANIILDGLRHIDFYRFKIIVPLEVSKKELDEFFLQYKSSFTEIEKEIIRQKYLSLKDNSIIAKDLNLNNKQVNRAIAHFNKLLNKFRIKDINLDKTIIAKEIDFHPAESVLNDLEKQLLSYYEGIANGFNPKEETLTITELSSKFNLSINQARKKVSMAKDKIKLRQLGLLKPEFLFIERDKIGKILKDIHVPITEEDKYIICSLLGINGIKYKTLKELGLELSCNEDHLRRKYYRAIVNIFKYRNKEIEGKINYEADIKPYLRYFSRSDRLFIDEYYVNNLSYQCIAKKYKISKDKVVVIFNRIKNILFEFMNNPQAKRYDFIFHEENKDNPNIPFYGNIGLISQVFDLLFGETSLERMNISDIIKKLDLNMERDFLTMMIYEFMVSMCKFQEGITKENTFSNEDVVEYYRKHSSEMSLFRLKVYSKYFKRVQHNKTTSVSSHISQKITYDLMREKIPNLFTIATSSRSEVLELLKKYSKSLNKSTKRFLMSIFHITEREFMSGKEKSSVYKILYILDRHIEMESEEELKERKKLDRERKKLVLVLKNALSYNQDK